MFIKLTPFTFSFLVVQVFSACRSVVANPQEGALHNLELQFQNLADYMVRASAEVTSERIGPVNYASQTSNYYKQNIRNELVEPTKAGCSTDHVHNLNLNSQPQLSCQYCIPFQSNDLQLTVRRRNQCQIAYDEMCNLIAHSINLNNTAPFSLKKLRINAKCKMHYSTIYSSGKHTTHRARLPAKELRHWSGICQVQRSPGLTQSASRGAISAYLGH